MAQASSPARANLMLNQHDINPPVKHRLDGDRMGKSYRDQIAKYSKSAHFGLGGVGKSRTKVSVIIIICLTADELMSVQRVLASQLITPTTGLKTPKAIKRPTSPPTSRT